MDTKAYCVDLANRAVVAGREIASTSGVKRSAALRAVAAALISNSAELQAANAQDILAGKEAGLAPAMLDRLRLDAKGIAKMADSVKQIAEQVDPVGQIIEGSVRPNGLRLQKIRVPIGVVFIIFESRPNVTSDAAALCIKSGNACILRGGKEALHSNAAIGRIVRQALIDSGIHADAVQLVETTDRAAVGELLKMEGKIDVVIPRGGESLIRAVVEQSHIPVIKHYTGNCHVYIDQHADHDMAEAISINSKTQRTGVCNATESFLFHKATVDSGLAKRILQSLKNKGVELRGCERTVALFPDAKPASEQDFFAEYLDMIASVKIVDSLDEAIEHINIHGSKHTDAIVTVHLPSAERFVQRVDSANVFVNCSTRMSDGGEYGLGAEIGISTDKLHSRGPMGAADLTTYKWVAYGDGVLRG